MHRRHPWTPVLLALVLALAGCNRSESRSAHSPEGAASHGAHEGHGETAAAPGAHEDHGQEEQREGVVELALAAQQLAKLAVTPARVQEVPAAFATTGEFEANSDRMANVRPHVSGRIVAVHKSAGDAVAAGETLATIHSSELAEVQAAWLEALAQVELARDTVERQRRLFQEDLTARKEVVAAEHALRLARLAAERSRQQLRTLGMTDERLRALAQHGRLDASLPLTAPLPGLISERRLTLGETVDPGRTEPIFVIVDPRQLWVNASLFEKDLARVRQGQLAEVTTPAYPGRSFHGRVTLLSPTLDRETRTARARITVANPEGLLRPEMFASIRIQVGTRQALAIPAAAIMQDKGDSYVFVQTGATTFEKRPVQFEPSSGHLVPVTAGLQVAERVVSAGAFTLKAELLKASFGEHEH